MKLQKKRGVIFIGSFLEFGKDGNVGGQMYACKTLLASEITDFVDWYLIDSTAPSNVYVSVINKFVRASRRFLKLLYFLCTKQSDTVLIFTSYGAGFIEKGCYILISKLFKKRVIICSRLGFLFDQIQGSFFFFYFARFVLKNADFVVCQGYFWQTFFTKKLEINPINLKVIMNWIDFDIYKNIKNNNCDSVSVTFIGWITLNKGVVDLLKAFNKCAECNENLILNIAGNGPLFDELLLDNQTSKFRERILFLNWVSGGDKLKLLAETDIFVLPSYLEGMPNSLIEAMASGKACIASEIGSIPELISHHQNGVLVTPGDVDSMADEILRLSRDSELRNRYGELARETIKKNHSLSNAINSFRKIL